MALLLRNMDDARNILEHFNWFHDSFIKRFAVTSRDKFTAPRAGELIGCDVARGFWVRIDFAHHNYRPGGGNARRIVRATFWDSEEIVFDLRLPEGSSGNRSIERIEMAPVVVLRRMGEKALIDLYVLWNVALPDRSWGTVRARILRFEHAEFCEV